MILVGGILVATWQGVVRWSEVDAAGIIYHAHVFDWFSETRIAWLADHGLDYYQVLRPAGIELLVKEAHASFSHALELGDAFSVYATLTQVSPTRCTFSYGVATSRIAKGFALTGTTEHAFVVEGRARRLDRLSPNVFDKLQTNLEPATGGRE